MFNEGVQQPVDLLAPAMFGSTGQLEGRQIASIEFCSSNVGSFRTRFTSEEDEKMRRLIDQLGLGNWTKVAESMQGRTARQCRERYNNYLNPSLRHGEWSKEEDELLFKLYGRYGANWNVISQRFQNRSRISIRNRYALVRNRVPEKPVQNRKARDKPKKQPKRENIESLLDQLIGEAETEQGGWDAEFNQDYRGW